MTFKLIQGNGTDPKPRIPRDDELEELLRESIEHVKRPPAEFRTGELVYAEVQDGWMIEIYQTGIRSFYAATSYTTPNFHGGQKRREKGPQPTQEAALTYGRLRAEKRADDASRHSQHTPLRGRRPRQPRRYLTTATVAEDMIPVVEAAIARDTEQELQSQGATCPVCTRAVSRDNMALHSHLMAHVRKKLITLDQKKEIQSTLQYRRRKGVA